MIIGLISRLWRGVFQSLPLPLPQIAIPELQQVTINPKNGRSERIYVNLEAVYPTPERLGTELSFEELRASRRGWLSKVWERELQDQKQNLDYESCEPIGESKISIDTVTRTVPVKLDIPRDPVMIDENGMKKEHHREGKQRRMKVKEVNETQISKSWIARIL